MTMFSPADLDSLRAMSGDAMPDEGVITRASGAPVLDPGTGLTTTPEPLTVYTGRIRVRAVSETDMVAMFGGEQVTTLRHVGVVPWDAPDIRIDDYVTVVESSDPMIAGHRFRVRAIPHGSYLVTRKLGLELVE